jgi:1-acyl-sn-glycerol-3-phosphate acyltransferase
MPRYKRFRLFDFVVNQPWTFVFDYLLLLMRMKLIGLEFVDRKRTTVYICNHQSWVDIPVVTRYTHTVTLSKKEATYIPFIGTLINFAGPVFVDRDDTSSRLKVVKEIITLLKQGYSLTLFPEGTRTKDGNLIEPNNAMVKLCYKLNVPVVAAALEGSREVLPRNRFYVKCFQKVVLKFNAPLYPKDFKNDEEFAIACWNKVVSSHNEILQNYFPEIK